ncbi:MAG: hypothetical protein NZ473_00240 [Candidatus Kapabacteria bacterium]|nr:hypothetical protein [Candidatus Kapabacteria bacterium]
MEHAPRMQGYYELRFYVDEKGMPARRPTERIATFYLSPSGGILRDHSFNIVLYSAKLDAYRGYGRLDGGEE